MVLVYTLALVCNVSSTQRPPRSSCGRWLLGITGCAWEAPPVQLRLLVNLLIAVMNSTYEKNQAGPMDGPMDGPIEFGPSVQQFCWTVSGVRSPCSFSGRHGERSAKIPITGMFSTRKTAENGWRLESNSQLDGQCYAHRIFGNPTWRISTKSMDLLLMGAPSSSQLYLLKSNHYQQSTSKHS